MAKKTEKTSKNSYDALISGYGDATSPKTDGASPSAWVDVYEAEPIVLESNAYTLSTIRTRVTQKGSDLRLDVRRWDYSHKTKVSYPKHGASVPLAEIPALQERIADVLAHVSAPEFTAAFAGVRK
jgi:hypothetical protein